MNVKEALNQLQLPKNIAINLESLDTPEGVSKALNTAEMRLESAKASQRNCSSDWEYWGYSKEIAIWSAIVDILKAAEIVGPTNLPDIKLERKSNILMDAGAEIKEYGKAVLKAAMEANDKPTKRIMEAIEIIKQEFDRLYGVEVSVDLKVFNAPSAVVTDRIINDIKENVPMVLYIFDGITDDYSYKVLASTELDITVYYPKEESTNE